LIDGIKANFSCLKFKDEENRAKVIPSGLTKILNSKSLLVPARAMQSIASGKFWENDTFYTKVTSFCHPKWHQKNQLSGNSVLTIDAKRVILES